MDFNIVFLVILFKILVTVNSAEILACLSSPSKSHHIIQTAILEELANRGHNVTVLSTFPKHKTDLPSNYHHIYLKLHDNDDWTNLRYKMLNNDTKTEFNQFRRVPKIIEMIVRRSKDIYHHEHLQRLLQSNQKFDLFVLGYNLNEMLLGIAGHFRIPSVLITTFAPMKSLRDITGNPYSIANVPAFNGANSSNNRFTLMHRILQFLTYTIEFCISCFVDIFVIEKTYYELFNETYTTFDEVKQNVSLVLTTTHFSEGVIRPLVPSLVEIGGIQINEKIKPLPKNIQEILNSSNEHGTVLFTLGGNIRCADLPNDKIQIFYRIFSRLNQTIIWKWETDTFPNGKPDNVFMLPWIPQSDLLAQPQIRFFISHCGAGGVNEAKYHGVPILAIPINGDQLANAKKVTDEGWALKINIDKLNETELDDAIQQLLTNKTYKLNAQKLSQLFRDRPLTPMQTAIFWIEYVIRHNGAKHMQNNAIYQNFIEKSSLDVIFVLLLSIYLLFKMIVMLIRFISKHKLLITISISILSYLLFILFY